MTSVSAQAPDAQKAALLVFEIASFRLAVRIEAVRRVVPAVEITPLPDAPASVAGVVNVHGDLVAVYDLRCRLGLPSRSVEPADFLILLQSSSRNFGILAEGVSGVKEQSELIPLGAELSASAGGSMTIIEDQIILVQDLDLFLSGEDDAQLQRALDHRG